MLLYGRHPFPADVEEMLRKLYRMNPALVGEESIPYSDYLDWREGINLDVGREKLRVKLSGRGGEVDRIMEEGFEQLQAILAKMTLTDDERRFVDDAARQLYQKTFSYLIDYPGYEQLRPVVIALAMAFWLGPSSSWDQCMRSVL
jgi:hypothetical protein